MKWGKKGIEMEQLMYLLLGLFLLFAVFAIIKGWHKDLWEFISKLLEWF